jgi:hypothetical protein
MKKNIFFLKVLLISIGIGVLSLSIIGLPLMYSHIKQMEIYGSVIGLQIISILFLTTIPFYYALVKALNILHYITNEREFSKESISDLDSISKASQIISLVYILSLIILRIQNVLNMTFYIVGASIVLIIIIINAFVGVFRELLIYASEIKEENDLTI